MVSMWTALTQQSYIAPDKPLQSNVKPLILKCFSEPCSYLAYIKW